MIGKMEQVLTYIEALVPGERVSVRQLAQALSVSEGTAYKAIKCAKECGLVQSKPKSGTVRVGENGQLPVGRPSFPAAGTSISDTAGNWMDTPVYLYRDDVVADWYRSYRRIFDLLSRCAVVDGNRQICGTVDAMQVVSAEMTCRISSMPEAERQCLVVDEDTPLSVLAERMIAEHSMIAYVTRENEVSGIITANELLRYYLLHTPAADVSQKPVPVVEDSYADQTEEHLVCRASFPGMTGSQIVRPSGFWISLMVEAAGLHGRRLFSGNCECEVGSFYMLCGDWKGSYLKISSEADKKGDDSCMLLLELYDDSTVYARGTVIISRKERQDVFIDG